MHACATSKTPPLSFEGETFSSRGRVVTGWRSRHQTSCCFLLFFLLFSGSELLPEFISERNGILRNSLETSCSETRSETVHTSELYKGRPGHSGHSCNRTNNSEVFLETQQPHPVGEHLALSQRPSLRASEPPLREFPGIPIARGHLTSVPQSTRIRSSERDFPSK